MNPLTQDDIVHGEGWVLDPEYLIVVTQRTHNAIHFGDRESLPRPPVERTPHDTAPWRR